MTHDRQSLMDRYTRRVPDGRLFVLADDGRTILGQIENGCLVIKKRWKGQTRLHVVPLSVLLGVAGWSYHDGYWRENISTRAGK